MELGQEISRGFTIREIDDETWEVAPAREHGTAGMADFPG